MLEPPSDLPASITDLQCALPHLGQEHPCQNRALAMKFSEARLELPLALLIWLVRILSVQEHVDEALRRERACPLLHEGSDIRHAVKMILVLLRHPSDPLAVGMVAKRLPENRDNLHE